MITPVEAVARVRAALNESELLRAVLSVRRDGGRALALGGVRLRLLTPGEIGQLEQQGNWAESWSRVRVADGFDPGTVRLSSFHGDVTLGQFARAVRLAEGVNLPSGIYRSTLANCVIGHHALVRDVRLLANQVVGEGAVLLDCGCLMCAGETTFGNGRVLPLAVETGGREVAVYAEIDLETAAAIARWRSQQEILREYNAVVAQYTAAAASRYGIIERGASVRNTPQISNSYLGPAARVENATLVADSTLLSSAEEPTAVLSGGCVSSSLLQWGSQVSTLAVVEKSVLTEYSGVERHGQVVESLLGPNTKVAEGEVTASLLGPFVGFHHQALLIAALWPEGKGNVAYGANVGSNHTSRVPDQEFWPGEGLYLGLGVNVKYPADFTQAPYTIIATGVSTLPQKVAFPFSLINKPWLPCPEISPAYNEIIPAWVLTDDLYMLTRNEGKYRQRNRARRTRFDFAVFRPDTVDLMRDACRRLENVGCSKESYTERDLEGLGKNFMKEKSRTQAIEAYRFFIRYYALLGLKEQVERLLQNQGKNALTGLLTSAGEQQPWEHQRQILHEEMGLSDIGEGLHQLPAMLQEVARRIERSKAKDDQRGLRILEDYAEAHTSAARDGFVQQSWNDTRQQIAEVEQLIAQAA